MAELLDIDWQRPIAINCVDDRGLVGNQQNLKAGGAGPYGLAQDLFVARSMKYSDAYCESIRPLGETAKIIASGLGRIGLYASTHEECAAEGSILLIAQTIIERPEEILDRTSHIMRGDVNQSQYEQVVDSYKRMLFAPDARTFRCEKTEAACMDTDSKYRAIVRKLLAHEVHAADTMQINHEKNTWWDAANAYKNGQAVYHKDQWALEPIAEAIDDVLPHDNVDGFILASSIRTSAISLVLPRSGDPSTPGVDLKILAA